VRLSFEEFNALFAELQVKEHKVRHRRCTFLPGVNPAWEAREAEKARRYYDAGVKGGETRRRMKREALQRFPDGTIVESHPLDTQEGNQK